MTMREPDRLRELERIIGETTARDHHYQYDDVLKRYVAALEPHITDRDVATLAETDLDTWEQRHEARYDRDETGRDRAPDIDHSVLRLEFGWRVYPLGDARRADVQSSMRQFMREHIAYLEQWMRTSHRLIEVAEGQGEDTTALRETLADAEREREKTQKDLLSPTLRTDYPYATE
jgi:hypothetical protein